MACPSQLARLVKYLTCALHHRPMWNASFLSVGCWTTKSYVQVCPDERLSKLRQCWKKRPAHGNRLSETWCQWYRLTV